MSPFGPGPRSAVLALAAIAALTACRAVLDIDDAPIAPPASPEGGSPPAEGSLPRDGAPPDDVDSSSPDAEAGSDGGDPFFSLYEPLRKKRTRIADAPARAFASTSRLYWVDSKSVVHGSVRPGGPILDYTWPLSRVLDADGSDSLVVASPSFNTWSVYSASEANGLVAALPASVEHAFATPRGIVIVDTAGAVGLWTAAAPLKSLGAVGALTLVVGRKGSTVVLRDAVATTKAYAIDAAAETIETHTVVEYPSEAEPTPRGLVLLELIGGATHFALRTSGGIVDLDAEIARASSIVPAIDRTGFGNGRTSIAHYGPWFLYAARGGILAYHLIDKRLVPVQIRPRNATFLFTDVLVVEATGTLAFTELATSGGALYELELSEVLPP